jgi:arylsulfatase A-like enzyme
MTKHILLVTVDTLRADYVACYGKHDIETPNLDSVAAAGVRFDFHLTSIAATLSSHCSLMTGCTPAVHGITWNWMTQPCRRKTLARIGADAGYATVAVTSWRHFNDQAVFGFERAYCEGAFKCEETLADATVRRAQAWLDDVDPTTPQLWWVSFIDPHEPDTCPDPFPKTYVGEVEFTDVWIGELLRRWDERIGLDDTLVVITADHGEDLNSHGVTRGHGTQFLTNLHVPLLMQAPGHIAPGTVVSELTRQTDVLPTILDYCRLPMPYNVEGMSLRGLIEGTEADLRLVHHGHAFHDTDEPLPHYRSTLRNGEYAFHFGDDKNLEHIFDLRRDPEEETDIWP